MAARMVQKILVRKPPIGRRLTAGRNGTSHMYHENALDRGINNMFLLCAL